MWTRAQSQCFPCGGYFFSLLNFRKQHYVEKRFNFRAKSKTILHQEYMWILSIVFWINWPPVFACIPLMSGGSLTHSEASSQKYLEQCRPAPWSTRWLLVLRPCEVTLWTVSWALEDGLSPLWVRSSAQPICFWVLWPFPWRPATSQLRGPAWTEPRKATQALFLF